MATSADILFPGETDLPERDSEAYVNLLETTLLNQTEKLQHFQEDQKRMKLENQLKDVNLQLERSQHEAERERGRREEGRQARNKIYLGPVKPLRSEPVAKPVMIERLHIPEEEDQGKPREPIRTILYKVFTKPRRVRSFNNKLVFDLSVTQTVISLFGLFMLITLKPSYPNNTTWHLVFTVGGLAAGLCGIIVSRTKLARTIAIFFILNVVAILFSIAVIYYGAEVLRHTWQDRFMGVMIMTMGIGIMVLGIICSISAIRALKREYWSKKDPQEALLSSTRTTEDALLSSTRGADYSDVLQDSGDNGPPSKEGKPADFPDPPSPIKDKPPESE